MRVIESINRLKKISNAENKFLNKVVESFSSKFSPDMLTKQNIEADKATVKKLVSKLRSSLADVNTDDTTPVISTFDAYQQIKELSEQENTPGIRAVSFYFRTKWESNPHGYLSIKEVEDARQFSSSIIKKDIFPKTSKMIDSVFDSMLKKSLRSRVDIKKLDRVAESIENQEDFDTAMSIHGFSLDRADHREIREYIAYKVNTKNGKTFTDNFSSESKIRSVAKKLGGTPNFDVNDLKGILSEDWGITQASLDRKNKIKDIFEVRESVNGRMSLKDALSKSDIVYNVDARTGKKYIARKDIFGGYHLYVSSDEKDARHIARCSSFNELLDEVGTLQNRWEI